ncbi:hypothetical protein GPECTOR_16g538 [Gonium pectorale]|uniref:Uncharacterized protein n=1 Tax=Gonium pectorale TaxID=33097 RepID=A0A150GKV7_GONPE|nr:hypothetical protein GPECTOR_16g538 [Gonium pectorale]|eukprot:KXZ50365.1 hypothetical protein GPECTOR_16g538 [Gonium pectorale]
MFGVLLHAEELLSHLPAGRRDANIRFLIRAVMAEGGEVQTDVASNLAAAIATGHTGALDELLGQLAAGPGGHSRHVATMCSLLAGSSLLRNYVRKLGFACVKRNDRATSDMYWYDADMARLLVDAVRAATEGEGPHEYTWCAAMDAASCGGQVSALEGLLASGGPLSAAQGALSHAFKVPRNYEVLRRLLAAGARAGPGLLMLASYAADPWVIRAFVTDLRRHGPLPAGLADEAMVFAVTYRGYTSVAERAESVRILVQEAGADAQAALPLACARDGFSEEARCLAETLVSLGADADTALLQLCTVTAVSAHFDPKEVACHGTAVLLSLCRTTADGAAAALRAALLRPETLPRARLLLESGVVGQAACAALLRAVVRGELHGPPPADVAAAGASAAAAEHPRRAALRTLAKVGPFSAAAAGEVLLEAVAAGDAEAVRQLSAAGLVPPAACMDALRRAEEAAAAAEAAVVAAEAEKTRREAVVRALRGPGLAGALPWHVGSAPYCHLRRVHVSDWLPYVGTYNEGEFPSGAGGDDNYNPPISWTYGKGCSLREPFTWPTKDTTFSASNAQEFIALCKDARVWGGSHFRVAVEAGQQACSGVVAHVWGRISALYPRLGGRKC